MEKVMEKNIAKSVGTLVDKGAVYFIKSLFHVLLMLPRILICVRGGKRLERCLFHPKR